MPYVIYHKRTTKLISDRSDRVDWYGQTYSTAGSAKAGLTRMEKAGKVLKKDYDIAEVNIYEKEIKKC